MTPQFIYSDKYNFSIPGLDKLHSFDTTKYSKAWNLFKDEIDLMACSCWIEPKEPISNDSLLKIHSQSYLDALNNSTVISGVIEIWLARFIPATYLTKKIINPIKLACEGTVLATQAAMKHGIAMNFAGGYHHAFSDHGEGFCFFADVALGIIESRDAGLLSKDDTVVMIDLDAHRGNGFESIMQNDNSVKIFDMYNFQNYPGIHPGDTGAYPFIIPLKRNMGDEHYLGTLKRELPDFLNQYPDARLAIYNAGSDILESDTLGGYKVSFAGVKERDRYVLQELVNRNIPVAIVTSGGYSKESYKLVAELAKTALSFSA